MAAIAGLTVSRQVWSALTGYTGDGQYASPSKDTRAACATGAFRRCTKGSEKTGYSPNLRARERASTRPFRAAFAGALRPKIRRPDPMLAVTFDSEPFGHVFEGVDLVGLGYAADDLVCARHRR